jgi:hypothetical protein
MTPAARVLGACSTRSRVSHRNADAEQDGPAAYGRDRPSRPVRMRFRDAGLIRGQCSGTTRPGVGKRSFADRWAQGPRPAGSASRTGVEKLRRIDRPITYFRHVLFGYARVSTADQYPDHQIDPLERAGVGREDIYAGHRHEHGRRSSNVRPRCGPRGARSARGPSSVTSPLVTRTRAPGRLLCAWGRLPKLRASYQALLCGSGQLREFRAY